MFKGSIVALVTPFDAAGNLDLRAFGQLLEYHLANGTEALVVGGSTGESASLSEQELVTLVVTARSQLRDRIGLIAGSGNPSTSRAIATSQAAAAAGADALLVVTPAYVRPPQRGLEAYFEAVVASTSVPVLLYNVPSRTAVDLHPSTVGRLAAHPRIIGIKEAVADMGRVKQLRELTDAGFVILSGDDGTCLQAMQCGADGVISVAGNVAPARFRKLCDAALGADPAGADLQFRALRPLLDALGTEPNPIPVKWGVHELGLCEPHLRLPLMELSAPYRAPLRQTLSDLGLLN